jgi:energy-converting hydrogenase B subunit Q
MGHLGEVAGVESVRETPSFAKIYGKRVIVMGGGAQVGLVAMGAITEADRHNIRGERISVDTIPLVGERNCGGGSRGDAAAARQDAGAGRLADGRRHHGRRRGSTAQRPARHLAEHGGSVPDAADLVVSDPVQAGVMAVMAVADTAKFDLMRQLKRRY